VYYVSLKGVTGAANLDVEEVAKRVAQIKTKTDLPIGVGFGIRDANTAKAMAQIADGVVVGSRIVNAIETSDEESLLTNIAALMVTLKSAVLEA